MGYYAQPFAVDLNQVRQVLGSKDLALIEKVKAAHLYNTYAEQSESDYHDLLNDLIMNYVKPADRKESSGGFFGLFKSKPSTGLRPDLAHEYGYVMLIICDVLGTNLTGYNDIFYAGNNWKAANTLLKSKGISLDLDRMWGSEQLFDIPRIPDFPVISHYAKSEIDYLVKELNKIDPPDGLSEDDDQEGVIQILKAFRDGLRVCQQKNVEWVSFLH